MQLEINEERKTSIGYFKGVTPTKSEIGQPYKLRKSLALGGSSF
jgi:hypothetical protein